MFKLVFLMRAAAFTAICMALTPAIFAAGPYLEARYFPVVLATDIEDDERVEIGASFSKVRQGEFLGLSWYVGPVRVPVKFAPSAINSPRSGPPGDQYAGPWLVVTREGSVRGNVAYAYHRCHPLWVTISEFYPG